MAFTTDAVRDLGFLPYRSDIPEGMTVAEYRARRAWGRQRPSRRRRRRLTAWRLGRG